MFWVILLMKEGKFMLLFKIIKMGVIVVVVIGFGVVSV